MVSTVVGTAAAIDRFLSEGQREQYVPGALGKVAVGDHLMAWPCQIQPRLWAASRREAGRLSASGAAVLDEWRQGSFGQGMIRRQPRTNY